MALRKDLHPSLQMQLARLYRVDEWVEPVFQRLINIPFESLNEGDAERMGLGMYFLLARTKRLLDLERLYIAFTPPPAINDPACYDPQSCTSGWGKSWWVFAKHLLHPDHRISSEEALMKLDTVRLPKTCDGCLRSTVGALKDRGGFLSEEDILAEALGRAMEIQTEKTAQTATQTTDAGSARSTKVLQF